MKSLFLYGANCTKDVWKEFKKYIDTKEIIFEEYPHSITKDAKDVSDVTKWVYEKYKDEKIDLIVGHSMGGIIGLELVSKYKFNCNNVIIIESNLMPAKQFYCSLLTDDNMRVYGESVIEMLKGEMMFYSGDLKRSLQREFDYTEYVKKYDGNVFAIYGDRNISDNENRISDLCLDTETEEKMEFHFIKDSAHMIMIENPKELAEEIKEICTNINLEEIIK